MSVWYHVEKEYKRNRISQFVSKRAALLVISGFIVLKIINISVALKNREVSFTWFAIHLTDINSNINTILTLTVTLTLYTYEPHFEP